MANENNDQTSELYNKDAWQGASSLDAETRKNLQEWMQKEQEDYMKERDRKRKIHAASAIVGAVFAAALVKWPVRTAIAYTGLRIFGGLANNVLRAAGALDENGDWIQ